MLLIDHLDLPLIAIIFGVALAGTAILADATIRVWRTPNNGSVRLLRDLCECRRLLKREAAPRKRDGLYLGGTGG